MDNLNVLVPYSELRLFNRPACQVAPLTFKAQDALIHIDCARSNEYHEEVICAAVQRSKSQISAVSINPDRYALLISPHPFCRVDLQCLMKMGIEDSELWTNPNPLHQGHKTISDSMPAHWHQLH